MLRLTLADNAIELYENIPVNLSYQFADLQNINSSRSSFSQTFRVPLTKKNQDYFGAVNELGLIPTWNPKTKVSAELSYNSVPIMRGFAQVKGIYIQKGKYADVELVVFGETANLSQDVGNGMLTELGLSALDHTLSATNISASWAGTLSSGAIRYGLPDKGKNWTSSNIWTTADPLEHGNFTPYIRTSKVFDTILTDAGYTYTSTFFGSNLDALYLLMNRGNRSPIAVDADQPASNVFNIGLAADLSNGANTWTPITTFSEATPFYDTGGNVLSGAFTAPFRAYYTFRAYASGNINNTITTVSLRLSKNTSTSIFPIITDFPGAVFNESVYVVTSSRILLNTNDVVRFDTIISDNAHTLTLYGTNVLGAGGTGFEVINITEPLSGQTVDVAANLPEMKQIDFVAGLQKCFNLVFIPDRNNSKHLYIEPLGDYLASGTAKDWTNKIDLSKDIQVEPTTDLQARTYTWTHSNGKDLVNDLVQKNASRVYGRFRVNDPDNDFATGEKTIKSPFAPHVASYIPGTDFAIHRMLADTTDEDKSIKDPLPRLAFWNGTPAGVLYYQNDANSAAIPTTTYPMLSQYSANYATVVNEDLGFGAERPFHRIEANPMDTLYYKYWRPWVNELYSADARIITAFFRLTASEIAQFEFSDKIYLKDAYFRILEVKSFDPTTEGVVQVRMVKILGDIRDCLYIPVSSDRFGRITFSTSAGGTIAQISPTYKSCCTGYGYIYIEDNASALDGACFQNMPQ